jgi:phosphotransferase system HPr (HPr) family protein
VTAGRGREARPAESGERGAPGAEASVRVRIADRDGLHARPCARISEAALASRCEVVLVLGGKTANALSVFEMLGLGAGGGAEVEVRARGSGAAAAAKRIAEILARPGDP